MGKQPYHAFENRSPLADVGGSRVWPWTVLALIVILGLAAQLLP